MKIRAIALLIILIFPLIFSSRFAGLDVDVPEGRKRIAFDETHNEVHRLSDDYGGLHDLLESSGFEAESLTEGPLTLSKLREYSVLVLPLPRKALLEEEIDAIISFVEGGGGLFIIGDSGGDRFWRSNVNNLSRIFGIIFNPDIVRAPIEPVIINQFQQHPITSDVRQIVYRTGSSLKITGNATGLATASGEAWADELDGQIGIPEPGERKGEDVIVLAASNFGLGRIVCLGSSTLFIDSNLIIDHKKICLNILRWLSSTEPLRTFIQNRFLRLKFFDDNLHSSYQIDVWDNDAKRWITAYHDIRFYTTSREGFNYTWNVGGATIRTRSAGEYQVLIVKYPETGQYGYESKVIDIGSEMDETNLYGEGWSKPFIFKNRTVRQVLPRREDIHLLLDYPKHPWLQYNLSLIYADAGRGRVDINILTWKGWRTVKSFYINGTNKWTSISLPLNLSGVYVDSKTNQMRIGIHVEGDSFIIDKVILKNSAPSGSLEILAFLSKDSPIVSFFIRAFGFQLDGVGIVADLRTRYVTGKRFAFSSLLIDASSEKANKAQITQGSCLNVLNLGEDDAFSECPSSIKDMYIYGEGWSEPLLLRKGLKAREAIAEKTNTFIVVPAPPSPKVLYNLSISYLDLGILPVDVNLFNGSDWISIGHIRRENTGSWRTATFHIPPSEMYFDPNVGGVKIGIYAYANNLVISEIKTEWKTLGNSSTAVAFSCEHDKIVDFILVPGRNNQVFQHELDGVNHVIKTIDIFTPLSIVNGNGKALPVAAVGSYIMDTSTLLVEAEDLIVEGWRPKPIEFSNLLTPSSLAVARVNSSSMNFKFSLSNSSLYSIFVRYFDFAEDSSDKKIMVSVNNRRVGIIRYEGSGKIQTWRRDIDLPAGTNIITLTPISEIPTSEIAFIDYVLVAPRFWEEEAARELRSIENILEEMKVDF